MRSRSVAKRSNEVFLYLRATYRFLIIDFVFLQEEKKQIDQREQQHLCWKGVTRPRAIKMAAENYHLKWDSHLSYLNTSIATLYK